MDNGEFSKEFLTKRFERGKSLRQMQKRKDEDQNRGLDLIFTNLLGLTMDG